MTDEFNEIVFPVSRSSVVKSAKTTAAGNWKRYITHDTVVRESTVPNSITCLQRMKSCWRWMLDTFKPSESEGHNHTDVDYPGEHSHGEKKILLLELRQLVFTAFEATDVLRENHEIPKSLKNQPNIKYLVRGDWFDFFDEMSLHYTVGIWTVMSKEESKNLVEALDPLCKISLQYYREDCKIKKLQGRSEVVLKMPEKLKINKNDLVIIDVSLANEVNPVSISECSQNACLIPLYTGDDNDSNLFELVKPLVYISKRKDVRPVSSQIEYYNKRVAEMMDVTQKIIPNDETHDRRLVKVQAFQENNLKNKNINFSSIDRQSSRKKMTENMKGTKILKKTQIKSPDKERFSFGRVRIGDDPKSLTPLVNIESSLEHMSRPEPNKVEMIEDGKKQQQMSFTFALSPSNNKNKTLEPEPVLNNIKFSGLKNQQLRLSVLISHKDISPRKDRHLLKEIDEIGLQRIESCQSVLHKTGLNRQSPRKNGSPGSKAKTHIVQNKDSLFTFIGQIRKQNEATRLRTTIIHSINRLE